MKKKTIKLIILYLFVWVICIGSFWAMGNVDAMGYSIIVLWLVLPISAGVVSYFAGYEIKTKSKWFLVLLFGLMHLLAEYTTFSLSNMLTFDKFNLPEPTALLIGAAASAIGIGVNVLVNKKRNDKNE